jgi:hypothetical protein
LGGQIWIQHSYIDIVKAHCVLSSSTNDYVLYQKTKVWAQFPPLNGFDIRMVAEGLRDEEMISGRVEPGFTYHGANIKTRDIIMDMINYNVDYLLRKSLHLRKACSS